MPSESLKKSRFRSDFPRAGRCLRRRKTFLGTNPRPENNSRSGVTFRPRQPSTSLPAKAGSDGWLAPLGPGLAPKLLKGWSAPRLRLRLDRVRPPAVHMLRRIRVGTRRPHPSFGGAAVFLPPGEAVFLPPGEAVSQPPNFRIPMWRRKNGRLKFAPSSDYRKNRTGFSGRPPNWIS